MTHWTDRIEDIQPRLTPLPDGWWLAVNPHGEPRVGVVGSMPQIATQRFRYAVQRRAELWREATYVTHPSYKLEEPEMTPERRAALDEAKDHARARRAVSVVRPTTPNAGRSPTALVANPEEG